MNFCNWGLRTGVMGRALAVAVASVLCPVLVGVPLRQRKAWARMMALLLGSVDLLLLPYGTALGIYALWVLLNEEGKRLFVAD